MLRPTHLLCVTQLFNNPTEIDLQVIVKNIKFETHSYDLQF